MSREAVAWVGDGGCWRGKEGVSCPASALLSHPPLFFFSSLTVLDFLLPKKGNSFSSIRPSVGWMEGGDETALNEKRLRVEKGAEPERNVARRRGADDSGGIKRIHSWPARCYV